MPIPIPSPWRGGGLNWLVPSGRRSGETVSLVAILLVLFGLKLAFNPSPLGNLKYDDGAYNYQIARHVAEGDGLVTSVSLDHWGLRYLPHAAVSYPFWPLLLGMAGRVIGLPRAAQLVPELFYFTTLLLLYAVGRRVAGAFGRGDEIVLGRGLRWHTGHWVVLLFGLNPLFFEFTSLPFSEGLGFTLAFGALLLVPGPRPSPRFGVRGALAGLVSALCYLTRPQALGFPAAVAVAMGLAGGRERGYRRAALAALLAAAIVVGAWGLHVFRSLDRFTPLLLADHTSVHESTALAPYLWFVETPSAWDYVTDRVHGLAFAFSPRGACSYVRSFGPAAYLVPLALVFFVADRRRWSAALASIRDPAFVPVSAVLLSGLALLLPVHNYHSFRWGGWFFQFRVGLPLILPLVVAIPYLLTRHRVMRASVILLLVVSAAMNGQRLRQLLAAPHPPPAPGLQALAQWIDERSRPPLLLSTAAAPLGALSRASVHWITCGDREAQIRTYFDHFGIEYLVTVDSEHDCPFFLDMQGALEEVRSFGEPGRRFTVWRLVG
jgi:hypothetical protein